MRSGEIVTAALEGGGTIDFVYDANAPRGGMKHTFFTPDRKYAVQFFNDWVPVNRHPAWIRDAKSKPFIDDLGEKLKAALPEDIAALLRKKIEEKMNNGEGAQPAPADGAGDAAPAEDTGAGAATETPQQPQTQPQ